ncbi:unnamed protein product [Penicillium nalgiovense]|uniref:Uncharacterized protein n=1 Tax=Penicillium nalgiovense TaxID=60175 RepID=A0A9W4MVA7_PENNA|nr:unnamed protein product [Penicillium nalgiovense]CAG8025628.1 unnamed protein product [Penicillium nalgiovense]CAG8039292.1 unnamed protein product [Penicillium nalgiovense]CAG8055606.1 unnamed protein product [Penicillium nalgiovense]CAG8059745.1 unnamed protein product [Penicillium nalgiovense]
MSPVEDFYFPFPRTSFRAAETTLIVQQVWFLGSKYLKRAIKRQHKLNDRTTSLISSCQALRKYRYLPWGKRRALAKNRLLRNCAHRMAGELADCDLALLSLLAWHFSSKMVPLPHGLLQFFANFDEQFDTVCQSIYLSYTKMCEPDTLANFKERLRGLLERHVIIGDGVLYT